MTDTTDTTDTINQSSEMYQAGAEAFRRGIGLAVALFVFDSYLGGLCNLSDRDIQEFKAGYESAQRGENSKAN